MTRTPLATAIMLMFVVAGCARQSVQAPPDVLVTQSTPAAPTPDIRREMPPNAPPDRLINVTEDLQTQLDALSKQARQQLPKVRQRFLKGLPTGEAMFIMTNVRNPEGKRENAFVQVLKWEKGQVAGAVASDMVYVTNIKRGDAITVPEANIVDWMISRADGSEEGNVVGKYMDAHGSALQK